MIEIKVNNGESIIQVEGKGFHIVAEFMVMLDAIKNDDAISALFNTALTLHEEKQK